MTIGASFASSELRLGVTYNLPFVAGDIFGRTIGEVTWRISDGQVPPGLQLQSNGTQATISGTPTTEGRYSVTLEAQDQYPQTARLTTVLDVTNPVLITTTSLAEGRTGREYNVVLSATGGVRPYQWSATNLPPGLNIDAATGIVSGIPTVAQFFVKPQIRVSDSSVPPQNDSRFIDAGVSDPLQLLDTMPKASLNRLYCEQVPFSGGGSTRTLQLLSGSPPPGLTLNFDQICGTPTQAGDFPLTFRAQETTPVPDEVTKTIVLRVDDLVYVVRPEARDAWQDQPFSYFVAAGNGTPPYHWSAVGLPSGLSLDPDTGEIGGVATAAGGFYTYSATVSDSSMLAQSDTRAGSIRVREHLEFAGVPEPVRLRDGRNISPSIPVRGGDGNYIWRLVSGDLPPGISLNTGGFRGFATEVGSYPFRAEVSDTSPGPYIIQGDFTFNVVPPPLGILVQISLPLASRGVGYHTEVAVASGGVSPYQWSIVGGQLPPGLGLDAATGAIDGMPTQAGRFVFQALVRDSDTPANAISQWYVITVRPPLGRNDSIQTATPARNLGMDASISPYIDPVSSSLPNPDQDFYRIMAPGGTAVLVRVNDASFLDSVLELLSASGQRMQSCGAPAYTSTCLGHLSGGVSLDVAVPGAAGTPSTFYARVLDWRGDARPDMRYTFVVLGAIDPLTIQQTTLAPGGIRGKMYKKFLTTTGGTGSVEWSLAGGTLPPGWTLGGTGVLSGVATATGTYTFTIRATDSGTPPEITQREFTVQIAEPLAITSAPVLPTVCLGVAYSFPIDFTGGHPPYFMGGPVLGTDGSMRTYFSGFASLLGTFTSTVMLRDSGDPENSDSREIKLTVVNCP